MMLTHVLKGSPWLGSSLALLLVLSNPYLDDPNRVTGEEVAKRTERVAQEIPWAADFDEARTASIETGKPLFWLQVVGELNDGL